MRRRKRNERLFEPLLIARLSETPSGNAMLRTTAAPTIIAGGSKDNVLPSQARAVVNFRILPGETVEQTLAQARSVVAEPRITFRLLDGASEPSRVSAADSAAFAALRKTIEQVFPGVAVAPSLVIAATDSRHFAGIADDVYRFLPVPLDAAGIERIHGANERISIGDYGNAVRFYIQLLRNTAL